MYAKLFPTLGVPTPYCLLRPMYHFSNFLFKLILILGPVLPVGKGHLYLLKGLVVG